MSTDTQRSQPATAVRKGRTVAWSTWGDPQGVPVVYFHGAGGSRIEAEILDADAAAAGLRIISVDRPGCGQSDPMADRTLLSSVADLAVVLEHERLERVATSGMSAGAMYAWAAAHVFPSQVTGVVAISPAVPASVPAVRAHLGGQFKTMAFLARRVPGLFSALQRRQTSDRLGPDGQAKTVKTFKRISPADADTLSDATIFEWFRAASEEGRRQGEIGDGRLEFVLMTTPWGFDPATLTASMQVVLGERDPLGPAQRAFAGLCPSMVEHVLPGAGHIVIAIPEGRKVVLDALAAVSGPVAP